MNPLTMFRALLAKDLRVNATVLLVSLGAWLAPYAVLTSHRMIYDLPAGLAREGWSSTLQAAAALSLAASVVAGLLLGANAFAAERSDRSAEFLALLPVSRRQIVASKLLVALAPLAIIWGTGLPLIYGLDRLTPVEVGPVIFACLLLVFGVSWLGSSFLGSPMNALGLTLGVVMVLLLIIGQADYVYRDAIGTRQFTIAIFGLFAALGVAGFVAGTWIALRRIEP